MNAIPSPRVGTILLLLFLGASSVGVRAQPVDAVEAIETTVGRFLDAITRRDVVAMREVLARRFVAMDAITESGRPSARIEVIDPATSDRILPPKGNTDLANLKVASMKVEFSESNPTAAIASFVATRSLTGEELEVLKRGLGVDLDKAAEAGGESARVTAQRARMARWVSEKQVRLAMLAMLGFQDGKWRIVCLSAPG